MLQVLIVTYLNLKGVEFTREYSVKSCAEAQVKIIRNVRMGKVKFECRRKK